MSRGSTDSGDGNPIAAGRIGRTAFILLAFVLVMLALGKMIGLLSFGGSSLDRENIGLGNGGAELVETDAAQQAFLANGGPKTAASARAAVRKLVQLQNTIDTFSGEDRARATAQRNRLAREIMEARMKAYHEASPKKKRAELDRQIRQDELMRQAWRASGSTGATAAARQGFPGGFGGWFDGDETGGSDDDLNRELKKFLDSTTPEQRARYTEYLRAMEVRRKQLGMSR